MGDPACWLDRTCPSCARLLEDGELEAGRCPRCGAPLQEPDDGAPGLGG